ncbi:peptide-N(4)-(N-acetyl-beta-glucosaminyl)asparagine amidase-like [Ptychodera flava]|uniref:peptide-N(4)-(N-acetyl-beta- glucosaminyl)asparagine amidase-like n=1 Tax=Ptychodera flava TaxID=63121 RepID=UPI003969F035
MATTDEKEVIGQLLQNETTVFLDTSDLLLKFAGNIIRNPSVAKYRSIRLGNTIVQSRILPVMGGMECLFAMGFQESSNSEYLVMPEEIPLERIRRVHDEIRTVREKKLTETQGAAATAARTSSSASESSQGDTLTCSSSGDAGTLIVTGATAAPSAESYQAREAGFFAKIRSYFDSVLVYEDRSVQQKARECIPLSELSQKAGQRMKTIQENVENAKGEKPPDMRDCLLLELLHWFKSDFFTWTNSPKCSRCGGDTRSVGMLDPMAEELKWGGSRVEGYVCNTCQQYTRFPRYNHPAKLLETRTGRCGEWANCFTLCCRAAGFEARHVIDWTDHVWTEVYTDSQQRWLHCDPCEDICDKPLIYEVGWAKKLSYIIAVSKDEIVDVTWRYTANQKEVMTRRNECREEWLVNTLAELNKQRQNGLPADRKQTLEMRTIMEIVEFLSIKRVKDGEEQGRSSGSLAWRLARGETGSVQHKPKAIKLTAQEVRKKCVHIRYICAGDYYQRVSDDNSEIKGWSALVMECENIQRKQEHDWKMVYLARSEGSSSAKISWKFDLTDSNVVVDTITVTARSQTFETGVVSWRLCSEEQCVLLDGGEDAMVTKDLKGASTVTLTAEMHGGRGDIAWQHTQLFRQSMDDQSVFPLDIRITLREK